MPPLSTQLTCGLRTPGGTHRLAKPSKYRPVALDPGDVVGQVETGRLRVTVMGWGATEYQGRRSSRLQEVTVNGYTPAACNSSDFYDGAITPNMLCAASAGKDSCQGDSGGPLIVDTQEQAASEVDYGEDVLVRALRCPAPGEGGSPRK